MSERIAYEEVPGSRTTQQAIDPPQRERIAYEELRPGTEVQPGDQYRNTQGRWVEYSMDTSGVPIVGPTAMARRPRNIRQMLAEFANQAEVLAEVRADEERLVNDLELLRSEYIKLQGERDELRAEIQHLLKTITDNADQFADAGKILEKERDEAQVELRRLQEVVNNLYDEPTARQVQQMLRTWATELDWSVGCFGSFGRSQIDIIQQTMVAVIERIEGMVNPEGGTDGE